MLTKLHNNANNCILNITQFMEVHQHPHVEKKSFKEYYTHFDLPHMPSKATQFLIICRDYSMMIASGIKIGTSIYGISIVPIKKTL